MRQDNEVQHISMAVKWLEFFNWKDILKENGWNQKTVIFAVSAVRNSTLTYITQFVCIFMVELIGVFESSSAFPNDVGIIIVGTCYVDHW